MLPFQSVNISFPSLTLNERHMQLVSIESYVAVVRLLQAHKMMRLLKLLWEGLGHKQKALLIYIIPLYLNEGFLLWDIPLPLHVLFK